MSHLRGDPYTPRLLLGVETSCDETSLALLEEGDRIRVNLVSSQVDLHAVYGGVVPEIACRRHLEVLNPLLEEALRRAGADLSEVEAVAVTHGPGLVGALLLGVAAAKVLAGTLGVPLIGVNHLEGHLYSPFLEHRELPLPLVCLLVSGGHTCLVHMPARGEYRLLGQTRDDAAGEAFDKVARALGMGYPGGPAVDRAARRGDPQAVPFPRPMLDDGYDFSFAGLKTAVFYHLREEARASPGAEGPAGAGARISPEDLCASFQEAVVDVLLAKTLRAARQLEVPSVVVAGGVACNSRLRERMDRACREEGRCLYLPSPALCTDNAAMIARAGWELARLGLRSPLELEVRPDLPLESRSGDPARREPYPGEPAGQDP